MATAQEIADFVKENGQATKEELNKRFPDLKGHMLGAATRLGIHKTEDGGYAVNEAPKPPAEKPAPAKRRKRRKTRKDKGTRKSQANSTPGTIPVIVAVEEPGDEGDDLEIDQENGVLRFGKMVMPFAGKVRRVVAKGFKKGLTVLTGLLPS